jgi:hypothetical protein
MKQIIQSYKNGKIGLSELPKSYCKAGGVLVRNMASLISAGTEKLMIEMGQKSLLGKARARPDLVRQAWAKAQKEGFVSVFKEAMNRLDEPVPLGYQALTLFEKGLEYAINWFKENWDRITNSASLGPGISSAVRSQVFNWGR